MQDKGSGGLRSLTLTTYPPTVSWTKSKTNRFVVRNPVSNLIYTIQFIKNELIVDL